MFSQLRTWEWINPLYRMGVRSQICGLSFPRQYEPAKPSALGHRTIDSQSKL